MIAILDAKPGMTDALRELIVGLGVRVRDEPGCVAFTVYERLDVEGRFYILETYANGRAFRDHLETAHVKFFIEQLPSVSPSSQEANLFQLDEIELRPNEVGPSPERALRT
jgi:quinol monooxygenase YgiN